MLMLAKTAGLENRMFPPPGSILRAGEMIGEWDASVSSRSTQPTARRAVGSVEEAGRGGRAMASRSEERGERRGDARAVGLGRGERSFEGEPSPLRREEGGDERTAMSANVTPPTRRGKTGVLRFDAWGEPHQSPRRTPSETYQCFVNERRSPRDARSRRG